MSDADSPETIPAWDSVGHLRLVVSLEAEFEVEFDPNEVGELITIGRLRQRLEQLRNGHGRD